MVARPVREDYTTAVIVRQEGELGQTLPLVVTGDTTIADMREMRNTVILVGASIITITLPTPTAGLDDGVRIAVVPTDANIAHIVTAGTLTLTFPAALADGAGFELVAHNGAYEIVSNSEAVIT